MVSSLCNVTIKNKYGESFTTTVRNWYNLYYMKGYNQVLCFEGEWDKVIKIQRKSRAYLNNLRLTNFRTLAISSNCLILTSIGPLDPKDVYNVILLNEDGLDIYAADIDRVQPVGVYSIITENNRFVQINDFYVRFNEIKRAQQD